MSEIIATLKKDYIYNLMIKDKRQTVAALKISGNSNSKQMLSPKQKVCKGHPWKHSGACRCETSDWNPVPDSQDEGVIITNLELNPIALLSLSPPPREDAIEMARVVDRGIGNQAQLI